MLIILFLALIAISSQSFSAEVELPITVQIEQCGKRERLEEACKRNSYCCPLIEPDSGTDGEGKDERKDSVNE